MLTWGASLRSAIDKVRATTRYNPWPMAQIYQERLPNGLWLVAERIEGVQSLAMVLSAPAGLSQEPDGKQGLCAVLEEMVTRGAGDLDARAHCDALDTLGVLRESSAGTHHFSISATLLHAQFPAAFPLLLDMIRKPTLDPEELDPCVDLTVQAIEGLEDEPQDKVFVELRKRHFPSPFGRPYLGELEDVQGLEIQDVQAFVNKQFVPGGSILAFAGNLDWASLRERVAKELGQWQGHAKPAVELAPAERGIDHEEAASQQCHIGLAYDAVPETHPNSVLQRVAVAVLSGGMSGRLFTEVREKRGLCYSVYASYAAGKDRGAVMSYAGTTAPRAQETFDVLREELLRMSKGVDRGEFDRAVVGMKSRLVMQGESTGSRANAINADQFLFGRPRTLGERAAEIDAVTLDQLNAFLRENPPGPMTVCTVGPTELKV